MKYRVISVSPSIDRNTGQQYVDQYGNLSWNISANDEQNQMYSFLKRTKQGNSAPVVGDTLEGKVELQTGKSGSTYYKFTAERKWEDGKGSSHSDPASYIVSYAKDIVVALIANQDSKTKLTTDNIKDDLETLSFHLMGLYNSLKENKMPEKPAESQTESQTVITANEEPPPHSDEDIKDLPF